MPNRVVVVVYTNWKQETDLRLIEPEPDGFYFGVTEHHQEPQWLLRVFDLRKKEHRTFAMSGIRSWRNATEKEIEDAKRSDSG